VALILTRKASHVIHRTVGAVATREGGVHVKTIDRWLREGVRAGDERVEFPKPALVINSVRFWKDEQLEQFEREVEAAVRRQRARLEDETPSSAADAEGGVSDSTTTEPVDTADVKARVPNC